MKFTIKTSNYLQGKKLWKFYP